MGYDDDLATRTAGRLAALALARACAETMTGTDLPPTAAIAAGLFLAGCPDDGPGQIPDLPSAVTWLIGAQAQIGGAALYGWAAARAGRQPTPAEVATVCDELETRLITPSAT